MFNKIKQSINSAGESIKEQAVSIGDAAKEKGFKIIDTWISTLPKLEAYGFKVHYFGISVSLNPTLEIEMNSTHEAFPMGRVEAILSENPGSTPIGIVFKAIKTAVQLHAKAGIESMNPLTVKINVRLSPEVKVSFGVLKLN